MASPMKRAQISVPLGPNLREFIEREAERADRTLAGQIRHLIAEAARQQSRAQERAA